MSAPATADEVIALVRRTQLVEPARLDAYLARLDERRLRPVEPKKMAGALVQDGFLTYFQAEQVLQGKYRGFTLGRYKILERLGFGGMGQVFLCEHQFMRRRVAIKVLPPAKAEDPTALARFYREARATAALNHPNIVRSHDVDQEGNLHFLVMEYVDGVSLMKLVRKHGPLDIARAAHYVRCAAEGLQHAHEAGLVHRDLKPGNLMVDRDGVVKVLDLGLARFKDDAEPLTQKHDDDSLLGTADYVAPEQTLNSHAVDIRADIYALGGTLYYLLTGQPPFPEGTVAEKLLAHQRQTPRPIREHREAVPAELAAVVEKMMAKRTADRYSTPGEVVAALQPFANTVVPPPAPHELHRLSPAASAPAEPGRVPAVATAGGPANDVFGRPLQRGPGGSSFTQFNLPPSGSGSLPSNHGRRTSSGSQQRADTQPRVATADDTATTSRPLRPRPVPIHRPGDFPTRGLALAAGAAAICAGLGIALWTRWAG